MLNLITKNKNRLIHWLKKLMPLLLKTSDVHDSSLTISFIYYCRPRKPQLNLSAIPSCASSKLRSSSARESLL